MSLPHVRRKARLQAQKLQLRVRAAETRERLKAVSSELSAMKPTPKKDA